MYYNIKIKCDGCEFSLDSSNKLIIESEMDKYFASMFDVSEEFKAQMKEVEIVDSGIKSIEDFKQIDVKSQSGNCQKDELLNEDNHPKQIQDNISEEKIIDDNEDEEYQAPVVEAAVATPCFDGDSLDKVPCVDLIKEEKYIQNTKAIDALFTSNKENISDNNEKSFRTTNDIDEFERINLDTEKNTPAETEIKPDASELPSELKNDDGSDFYSSETVDSKKSLNSNSLYPEITITNEQDDLSNDKEVNDLIAKVEQEIKSIDISNSSEFSDDLFEQIDKNEKEELPVDEELVFDKNGAIDVSKDLIVSEKTQELNSVDDLSTTMIEAEKIEQNELDEQEDLKTENLNQARLDDIFSDSDITLDEQNTQHEIQHPSDIEEIMNINPVPSYKEYLEQSKNVNNKIDSQNEQNNNSTLTFVSDDNIDFKTYLENYSYSELIDEFLICSYYIKNILKQDCFSMKLINFNLYNATGEIADMSIVGRLIELGYIETIEVEDKRKYTITPNGEEYFDSKYKK